MIMVQLALVGVIIYDASEEFYDFDLVRRILAYAGIAIPLLISTTVLAVLCMRNFGKGLLPILRRRRVSPATVTGHYRKDSDCTAEETDASLQLEPLRRRMDLD